MKLSQNFTKTTRETPADEVAKNAQLLIRAGYVHKAMPGVYAYLPLGLRMLNKIENIVRRNMNSIGGQEILMSTLHPKEWWLQANRWDNVDILFKVKSQTNNEYAIACSHEEQVVPIASSYFKSYKDLPSYETKSKFLFEIDIRDKLITSQRGLRYCAHNIIYCPSTNKYLIIDNSSTHSASYFDNYLIGGGIESGETKEEAILREFEEETGQSRSQILSYKYLGEVHQMFACPAIVGFDECNKNLISSMFYMEVKDFTDGFMEENTKKFEEKTKWVSYDDLLASILPGFKYVIENRDKLLNRAQDDSGVVFPLAIYQIQTKFRDEVRAKSGLLRGREFRMKDMYDFHTNKESQDAYYELVKETYHNIYAELGLKSYATTASGGIFTTNISHEFQVECDAGEDWIYRDSISGEVFNEEMAPCQAKIVDYTQEEERVREDRLEDGLIGTDSIVNAWGLAKTQTTKTLFFEDQNGQLVAVSVRGDRSVNESKLMNVSKKMLKLASEANVIKYTGAKIGYAGIINLPADIEIYYDTSLAKLKNFETGTNKNGYHTLNVCFGRDLPYPKKFFDLSEVQLGDINPHTGGEYERLKTAEAGNIFKIDDKYTKAFGVTYADENNKPATPLMNCHGIGTSRCLAIIAEKYSDEKGLKLPKQVAPFELHLMTHLDKDETINTQILNLANGIYEGKLKLVLNADESYKLLDTSNTSDLLAFASENSNFSLADLGSSDVLWDDRFGKISIGEKLKDADLIGCPLQLVISRRSLENGGLELIIRETGDKFVVEV